MTDVTICNKALSEMGARAKISALNEVSKEAEACALWYDDVRRSLLRSAHWAFARKQLLLTEVGNAVDGTALIPWGYEYEYPEDCIRLRYLFIDQTIVNGDVVPTGDGVFYPWMMPSRANRFLIGQGTEDTKVILTNLQSAVGVYTADITDTDQFDSGFEDAMVAGLASKLVIPLAGNADMKITFEQMARAVIDAARAADNEAIPTTDHTPDWILARNGGAAELPWQGPGMWYQYPANTGWGM